MAKTKHTSPIIQLRSKFCKLSREDIGNILEDPKFGLAVLETDTDEDRFLIDWGRKEGDSVLRNDFEDGDWTITENC